MNKIIKVTESYGYDSLTNKIIELKEVTND